MIELRVNAFAPTGPHEGQKQVLEALDAGERYVLLRCGRKWRKTSMMVSWLAEKALETGLTCPYIAPSKVQAKNIVWDDHISRLLTEFKTKGLRYKTNEVELSVKLPNEGKIQLFGVENQEGLRGISRWGAIAMDEYDDWTEDIFPLIIRPNLITHEAPAIVGGTPKGFRNIYRLEKGGLFKPFHFTSYQNPAISKEELKAMEHEYREMGEDYFQQEIMAEYVKPVGAVYRTWNVDKQYTTVDYDPSLPVHLTFDFGVNDPTAIIWIQPMGGEFRIFDYYEASNADTSHFIQIIKAKPYREPELCTGDPAGKARSITTNTSPIAEYEKAGIHIRTKDGITIPEQIRITHKFIKGVFVSDRLERLRNCFVNYRYPEKSGNLVNQSNELPVHDEYSHAMRALEYYFVNIDAGAISVNEMKPFQAWDSSMTGKYR